MLDTFHIAPMDRTERFYKIELLLRGRGCVSFADLGAELEVSPATLKRDLQYLRDRLGAPIVYDGFARGYRFDGAAAGASALHELPGLWFSENEIHALLTMQQLLAGLDDDGVLARHLQPLTDKLQGLLGSGAQESRVLLRRVKVIGTARRRAPSRHFELLGSALVRRRRVWLRYFKRSDQSLSEREVSPQRLVNYRNTWYLDAWCHKRDKLQRFALDAVESADVLDREAKDVAVKTVEAELDGGYGIFAGSTPQWATLVFSSSAAQWVSREEWHPMQETAWLDDGSYEMRLPYVNQTELLMDVLRHGGQVSVKAPASLTNMVNEQLRAALVANGRDQ